MTAILTGCFPQDRVPWRNALLATVPPGVLAPSLSEGASGELPPLLTLGQEQQMAAVRLSHYVYTLLCIISQQMTTIDRSVLPPAKLKKSKINMILSV